MAKRKGRGQTPEPKNRKKLRKDNFVIGDINDYMLPLRYETPIEIGCFSTDKDNEFLDNAHQMKYLSIPKCKFKKTRTERTWNGPNMDLNEGFDDFVGVYNDKETSFDKLLRWILSHKDEVENVFQRENSSKQGSSSSKEASSKIDFICTRKVLECILSTIYNKNNISVGNSERHKDWLICAVKFHDAIYLKKIETEEEKETVANRDNEIKRIIYYGRKFEKYLKSDSPKSKPDISRPVNVNEEYYAVLKARLHEHGLLFSAQMDAVDPKCSPSSVKRFVEIKTNYILNSKNRNDKFRSKLLSWYLQCFIPGVPRLICGFRNDDGIVEEMKEYLVSALPRLAKNLWSPNVCFKFGADFLSYIKECVCEDDPKVVHMFSWKPGEDEISHRCVLPVLPDWYVA